MLEKRYLRYLSVFVPGADINFTFEHCLFSHAQSTSLGAIVITYKPNEAGSPGPASNVMNITLSSCSFYGNINGGVAIIGDGSSILAGIGLSATDCYFESTPKPFVIDASYLSGLTALNIERNVYSNCGAALTNFPTAYKYDTGIALSTRNYLYEPLTIRSALTDGYNASMLMNPVYNTSNASAITRHNYIQVLNPTGTATATNACVLSFNAAAGTHKAVDSSTTKTTPTAVDAWVKININGTLAYIPAYLSKTT